MTDDFLLNFEVGSLQKYVNLVDLVKSFLTSIYYLLANNRLRYIRERASESSEVIQFFFSIHSLVADGELDLQKAAPFFMSKRRSLIRSTFQK